MRHVTASDGVRLAVIEAGHGTPIVFVHEFSGDARSWQPQFAHFGRFYRAIAFCARGYPLSDVPVAAASYSQARAADDVVAVIEALGCAPAHVIGLSMGGYAAVHVGIRHPGLVRSLTVAGCGHGSTPTRRPDAAAKSAQEAAHVRAIGMDAYARELADSSYARCLKGKDRGGWTLFARHLAEHSAAGMAHTLQEVLGKRPGLWELKSELRALRLPVFLVIGDEDEPCIEPNLFMKRMIADAALCILPRTGHLLNLEEPERFNSVVAAFVAAVDGGTWRDWRQPD